MGSGRSDLPSLGLRFSRTAQREWPRLTDRGRVCGLSRSPSRSAVPRLVIVARGVAVSVGAVDPAGRARKEIQGDPNVDARQARRSART